MTVVNAASVNFVARHAALMFGQQQKTKLFAFYCGRYDALARTRIEDV